ncbi:hypothetical protein GF402_11850 [Candidatus Fermentibacteria bacterium]|nr:hypothetical protein [Candidatus Fermentibacteria bacterium]
MRLDSETLRLDLGALGRGESRQSFTFDPRDVEWDLDQARPGSDTAELDLCVSARNSTFILRGSLEAIFVIPCARCLRPVRFETTEEIYKVYSSDPKLRDDSETVALTGSPSYLEILDAVREAVILSVPGKPLCVPDCKGLCPACGCNLNEESCPHTRPQR